MPRCIEWVAGRSQGFSLNCALGGSGAATQGRKTDLPAACEPVYSGTCTSRARKSAFSFSSSSTRSLSCYSSCLRFYRSRRLASRTCCRRSGVIMRFLFLAGSLLPLVSLAGCSIFLGISIAVRKQYFPGCSRHSELEDYAMGHASHRR